MVVRAAYAALLHYKQRSLKLFRYFLEEQPPPCKARKGCKARGAIKLQTNFFTPVRSFLQSCYEVSRATLLAYGVRRGRNEKRK